MMGITVSKLAEPVYEGDWHDPALRWEVAGGPIRQLFSTRKNAELFARLLRRMPFNDAVTAYIKESTK